MAVIAEMLTGRLSALEAEMSSKISLDAAAASNAENTAAHLEIAREVTGLKGQVIAM